MSKLYDWRFYKLGKEEYSKYMKAPFLDNLNSLFFSNWVVVILAVCFSVFPVFFEKNLSKAGVYLISAITALLAVILVKSRINQQKKGKRISDRFIYALTIIYYTNVILFGIYLGVLSNPDKLAVTFMGILICAMLPYINSPLFNLCLTLSAMIVFSLSTVLIKTQENWLYDVANVLIAGFISIIICWQVTSIRISQIVSAGNLREERDSYYNQSTTDELTQLKNRRDFTLTLNQYLNNFRNNDEWMWIAIADIDNFRKYNDYYGHPNGDLVLRAISRQFSVIQNILNVYAARIGGDEFALIHFEKDFAGADSIISNIQQRIAALNISHEKSEIAPHITLSIGVYIVCCKTPNDVDNLYRTAEKNLLQAKTYGCNCAVICVEDITQYVVKSA